MTGNSSLHFNGSRKVILLWLGLAFLGGLVVAGLWATFFSFRAASLAKTGQLAAAQTGLTKAAYGTKLLRGLTFNQPDIAFWDQSLQTSQVITSCAQVGQVYLQASIDQKPLPTTQTPTLTNCIGQIQASLDLSFQLLDKTWIIQRRIDWPTQKQIATSSQELLSIVQWLTTGQKRVVIFLQNNQELRATGGFMGSFIQIEISDGVITDWQLVDIYEPDGQFEGFAEAPPGVHEYLSGGQGWRLPDANWPADGPTAAQNVLRFMALGDRSDIDLAIFLNLPVAEEALRIIGSIPLPDYKSSATAENLAEIARADRNQFFAGSYQKTQFLNHLVTQLKFQLVNLEPIKYQQLIKLLAQKAETHDIWAFAAQPDMQQRLEQLGVANSLPPLPAETDSNHFWLYSVESNVGVNKANPHVIRNIALSVEPETTQLKLTFENKQPATTTDRLDYINYQRFLAPPNTELLTLKINDQLVESWDTQVVQLKDGRAVAQFGFLVTVPEGEKTEVTAIFKNHQVYRADQPLTITLPKQPGLASYPVSVTWNKEKEDFLIDKSIQNH